MARISFQVNPNGTQVPFADGSAAAPSITFASDLTTGLYRDTTSGSRVAITVSGNKVAEFNKGGTGATKIIMQSGTTNAVVTASANDLDISSGSNTGNVRIMSGIESFIVANFSGIGATAVNYVTITNAATGSGPVISATGSDVNVNVSISSKGAGAITIASQANSKILAQFIDGGASVNFLQFNPAITGSAPFINAAGSDVNIDLRVTPKGTGVLDINYAVTAVGGGASATLGTIGGSGPATAAMNSWLKVKVAGTASFIPLWR